MAFATASEQDFHDSVSRASDTDWFASDGPKDRAPDTEMNRPRYARRVQVT